jgi:hypothetical protein
MDTRNRTPLFGFALFGILLLSFVGIGYAMGWIEFHDDANRTTIEFDKNEASSDAKRAVERTEELLEDTGEVLRDAGGETSRRADE